MELNLLPEGDPILRTQSEPWDFEKDGSPAELVKAMTDRMLASKGIGLAAPQCGVMKNIFILGSPRQILVCINPMIITVSEEREMEIEGCLSFPNLWLKIKRPKSCVVKFQNVDGTITERELSGLMSRVFLHELDHLYGVTFDEKSASLSLKWAKEKRKKEALKKIKASKNKLKVASLQA